METTATTARPSVHIFGFAIRVTQTNGHSYFRNGYTEAEARETVARESGRADIATITLLENGTEVEV